VCVCVCVCVTCLWRVVGVEFQSDIAHCCREHHIRRHGGVYRVCLVGVCPLPVANSLEKVARGREKEQLDDDGCARGKYCQGLEWKQSRQSPPEEQTITIVTSQNNHEKSTKGQLRLLLQRTPLTIVLLLI
jgi:hypothetical protein